MDYVNTLKSSADKALRYGLDRDNVPFAEKTDGTKGRFIYLSSNHFKLQVTKGGRLGEVEFTRLSSSETLTRFKAGRDSFLVHTVTKTRDDGATKIDVGFQYKNERAALRIDEESAERGFTPETEKEIRAMVTRLRKNGELKPLMDDAKSFSDKSVLSGAMYARALNYVLTDSLDCIIAAGDCVLAIGAYIGSIGGLIALCPETIGATCLGVLLLHPVIGVLVAAKCAKALQVCGVTPPTPPTTAQYQAACLLAGLSWDSSNETCADAPVTQSTCESIGWYWDYASNTCSVNYGNYGGGGGGVTAGAASPATTSPSAATSPSIASARASRATGTSGRAPAPTSRRSSSTWPATASRSPTRRAGSTST